MDDDANLNSPEASSLSPEQLEELWCDIQKWSRQTLGLDDLSAEFIGDDWTLIVRLHAMIEAGLNAALVRQFEKPELADIIAKLDTSNMVVGKVVFAKALGILEKGSCAFIQKLSELRNFCVHDIRNFKLDLDKHVSENMESNKSHALLKVLNSQLRPEFRNHTSVQLMLIAGTVQVFAQLHVHELSCRTRDLERRVVEQRAELWSEHEKSTAKKGESSPQTQAPEA